MCQFMIQQQIYVLLNKYLIIIEMEQQAEGNRQQPQRNKQIIFIIVVYIILTMFSNLTSDTSPFNKAVITIINNPQAEIQVKTLMSLFATQNYAGSWRSANLKTLSELPNGSGTSKVTFQKYSSTQNVEYEFTFKLNNGLYADEGSVIMRTMIKSTSLQAQRNGTSVKIAYKKSSLNETVLRPACLYRKEKLLKTLDQKSLELDEFTLNIKYQQQQKKLQVKFDLDSFQQFQAEISIQKQQSMMFSTILFAILLFVISYAQFSAVMEMLRAIFEGRESAGNYSIFTILIATMWDAIICVVAFIEAFSNQESLILFIMPAFLLCLLFTNLQLRILLMIFQARADNNNNIRQIICKFNLITYGGLILMYPLLILTNLSSFFFIIISLIMLPQIYTNAMQGQRPNISSAYYSKFLTYRFLLILYLKCFPWNIFNLEPNYLLSFSCVALLAFQILLLWIQRQYGPKKVFPKFLLPPVFNYGCEETQMNVQEGTQIVQCAICLAPLNNEPDPAGDNNLNIPFRVMRGPCGHKFHGSCLGQWMQIKMECPQCRRKLPPFE